MNEDDIFNEWIKSEMAWRAKDPKNNLDIDFCDDNCFWDYENERSLSVYQAVKEGYFKSVGAARRRLNNLWKAYE